MRNVKTIRDVKILFSFKAHRLNKKRIGRNKKGIIIKI